MSLRDRIDIALEIAQTAEFVEAEGLPAATHEDPDLVGWMQADKNCVMLFRNQDSGETREIVDFVSGSFHPGLVIQYVNSQPQRADGSPITDARVRRSAGELLRQVRQVMRIAQGDDDFGCRY